MITFKLNNAESYLKQSDTFLKLIRDIIQFLRL